MLMTNDIGNLFQSMHTAYGSLWKHGQEAMPVWLSALKSHSPQDVQKAANAVLKYHVEYPPNLPQFLEIVRESTPRLSGPEQQSLVEVESIYAYTKPESNRNRNGNPHQISLPESIAQKKIVESVEDYRRRISDAMTFAKYPKLGYDGRSMSNYT